MMPRYNSEALEVVNGFKNVGLLFTSKMSMFSIIEDLASKGKRISLLNSLYDYGTIPMSIFFKLFDVKVLPILLYGA